MVIDDDQTLRDLQFLHWLKDDNGYTDIQLVSPEIWVGIYKFVFTHGIIVGRMHDRTGYFDRWCYHTYELAKTALDEWSADGWKGEPKGWHRHPLSGRRVNEAGEIYVNK